MNDPHAISATVVVCDWAEAINGKLYIQGAGWTRVMAGAPGSVAIALLIHVPYDQTNKQHLVTIRLLTEDGHPFPPAPPDLPSESDAGLVIRSGFEVGRPPGMKAGEQTNVPLAAKLNGIGFPPGGYRFEVQIDKDDPCAKVSFNSIQQAQPPQGMP